METEQKKKLKDETKILIEPLRLLFDDQEKLHEIINASIKGLLATQHLPKFAEVLGNLESTEDGKKKYSETAKESEKIAAISKAEIDSGFPFLFMNAALMLYAHLEGSIKRLIIEYFKNCNSLLTIKEIASLKIPFAEYNTLDDVEKYDYLFALYEKNLTHGIQYGINRFETLLKPIGFGGQVKEETGQTIYELSQVRNNILHRGGIADKYLNTNCPWLNLKVGDKVSVNQNQFTKYLDAIADYIMILVVRIGEKYGDDMSEIKTAYSSL